MNIRFKHFMRWLKGKQPDELVSRAEITARLTMQDGGLQRWEALMVELVDEHVGPIRADELYQMVRHMVKNDGGAYTMDAPNLSLWTKKYDWNEIGRMRTPPPDEQDDEPQR